MDDKVKKDLEVMKKIDDKFDIEGLNDMDSDSSSKRPIKKRNSVTKENENVKKVLVYVGAWRATNTTALYYNGVQIAAAEPFTAGDASLGYQIAFDINASEEVNLTLKTTALSRPSLQ